VTQALLTHCACRAERAHSFLADPEPTSKEVRYADAEKFQAKPIISIRLALSE
jgi:hypothetical protein